jgi:hypothetical protein
LTTVEPRRRIVQTGQRLQVVEAGQE